MSAAHLIMLNLLWKYNHHFVSSPNSYKLCYRMRYGLVQMLPNICHDDHLAGPIPVEIDADTPV